jgi:chromosome partitioning protein
VFLDCNRASRQAHVIICGNEKGGSGKTTMAMHIAVSLLISGYKVATIDLDLRQASLTSYIKNRERNIYKSGLDLPMPLHFQCQPGNSDSITENENVELGGFAEILSQVESNHEFVVVDTPGHDSYLMRLAHSMADTLITPMNDSYIDFDVLAKIDPKTGDVRDLSHYAQMVRDARRHRRRVDNGLIDWIVVRNRLSQLSSGTESSMLESLKDLSIRLGCRMADGISERVIFREIFPDGLTVLDEAPEQGPEKYQTLSYMSARQEIRQLVNILRLPIDAAGKKRADARKAWLENSNKPVENLNIFAE